MSPPVLAKRVKKARGEFTCPKCRCPVGVGVQIGLVPGTGWIHLRPCLLGGRAPMIGPSNEPASERPATKDGPPPTQEG